MEGSVGNDKLFRREESLFDIVCVSLFEAASAFPANAKLLSLSLFFKDVTLLDFFLLVESAPALLVIVRSVIVSLFSKVPEVCVISLNSCLRRRIS